MTDMIVYLIRKDPIGATCCLGVHVAVTAFLWSAGMGWWALAFFPAFYFVGWVLIRAVLFVERP